MKGFDLKGMEPHIDWVNVMSYDLHGSWDTPKLAQPHTNLTGTFVTTWACDMNESSVGRHI